MSDPTPPPEPTDAERRRVGRVTRIVVAVVLIVLALGAARTVISRMATGRALEQATSDHALMYVQTATPKASDTGPTLSLPGTLQGYVQSPIAARASGYLRKWYKDIGSKVEKGELLAEIETPEIDQQLSQAVAARAQAAASLDLAKSTVERWEALRQRDAVSAQELDERRSAYTQAQANLAAADANVERLRQLEGFKRIVAPFAGVITKRNVDVGDLIDAGSSSGGRALFLLAQTDPLRVYVNVPQAYSQLVRTGQKVVVTQAELRGQTFEGAVSRTSASIDSTTRTMLAEVNLPNPEHLLQPGSFAEVSASLKQHPNAVIIPPAALVTGDSGKAVFIVENGRVKKVSIKTGIDDGMAIEVLSGLEGTEQVIVGGQGQLKDGSPVTTSAYNLPKGEMASQRY